MNKKIFSKDLKERNFKMGNHKNDRRGRDNCNKARYRDRSRDRDCKEDRKKCYGYWGEPRDPKCPFPCKYEECNFDEIPHGSLYFAEHWDLYGAIRSLAAKQKYSLIGIVLQLSDKNDGKCKKKPYVLTVMYDQVVRLYPLCQLVNDPLVINQLVRPKYRTCNKCTDREQDEYLMKIARKYLRAPFETNSPQVARSIFDIPASNPNECSYTDTELVYRILYEAALIGDCCPKDDAKIQCMQKCSKFDVESCSCDSDPCKCKSKKPCDKSCCASSSSSADCPPCDKVDCYRASSVSICDFFTADNLDLRWYAGKIPVYTACLDACKRTEAIDRAFSQQKNKVIGNIRDLVSCWLSGDSMAYWKGNACSPCGKESPFCGKESPRCDPCEKPKCAPCEKPKCAPCEKPKCEEPKCYEVPKCADESESCPTTLCKNSTVAMATLGQVIGQLVNPTAPGTLENPRVLAGDLMLLYFQSVLDFLSCLCGDKCEKLKYPATTQFLTYTYTPTVGVAFPNPLQGCSADSEEEICRGSKLAILALKTIIDQLVNPLVPGTLASPRPVEGNLLIAYFQYVLDYLALLCKKVAPRLTFPATTQFITFSIVPLVAPTPAPAPCLPCQGGAGAGDQFSAFNELIANFENFGH